MEHKKDYSYVRKSFGENLRALRKSRGYSQSKIADMLDVTQAAVSSWEVAIRAPDMMVVFQLADMFRVPVSSLIPIETTGIDDDIDVKTVDFIRQNPQWVKIFDKVRHFDPVQTAAVMGVVNALSAESNED